MSYITLRRARIQAQLVKVQAALDAAYDMFTEQAGKENLSYEFDSGEGKQRTTRRSLKSIQDTISRLEASERSLINDLYNMGLVNFRLRRKRPTCF